MTEFSDLTAATRLRDVIRSLVREELERERPRYKYAQVVSINATAGTCVVTYAGEPGNNVTVKMGKIIRPTTAGQIVRVDGLSGDRFIADVLK